MVFVEWENKKILHIDVEDFFIQSEIFSATKCEIDFHPSNKDKILTDHFWEWMQKQEKRDLVISNKGNKKHYYLENGKPIFLSSNISGYVSTCKMKVDKINEITRSMKIFNILKQN